MSRTGLDRAWGWVDHLRDGGTTEWRDWHAPGVSRGPLLPGAQQLELLRRINQHGHRDAALAEAVLSASAPGRGRPDLDLTGVVEARVFGPPPVDPADLPATELIRVAASVIADRVCAHGPIAGPEPSWTRPWRRRYRLVGDPELARPIRDRLIARGRPPGGRSPLVLVLATDAETMLQHAYRTRLAETGAPGWRSWLRTIRARDQLPPRVDVLHTARVWADRVGERRVRIVTDPAQMAPLLGLRDRTPQPTSITPDGLELIRQVSLVLGVLVKPERRRVLVRQRLVPQVAAAAAGPGPTVPDRHREWVAAQAERQRLGLERAGFGSYGDLSVLLPPASAAKMRGSKAGVLDLAIRLMLGRMIG